MKNNKFIYFLLFSLFTAFYSCTNENEMFNSDNDTPAKTIQASEIAQIVANMKDKTVYGIDTESDLSSLCQKVSDLKEQELLSKGYTKVEPDENVNELRASAQEYSITVHPMGTPAIEYSQFKAKFSSKFCDEINAVTSSQYKISPNKTYICGWRDASAYGTLASNQRGGNMDSPNAALIPESKYGYSARGYNGYRSGNTFVMASHQLGILCEDVNHVTTELDIRYPRWDNSLGYVFNYRVLTP